MNDLVSFIVDARQAGETNDEILISLVEKGWENDAIVAAFLEADKIIPAVLAPPPAPEPLPELAIPPAEESLPRYVDPAVATSAAAGGSKKWMVVVLVLAFLAGGGFAFLKGYIPIPNFFHRTVKPSGGFADYEPINKNSVILLSESIRFTITGFQSMTASEYNGLQESGGGATIPNGNQAVLVYYTLQNSTDTAQVVSTSEGDDQTFTLVDGNLKRMDVASKVFSESLATLSDIKGSQYTSNALVFEVPASVTNIHDLYFVMKSPEAKPQKGYIQL